MLAQTAKSPSPIVPPGRRAPKGTAGKGAKAAPSDKGDKGSAKGSSKGKKPWAAGAAWAPSKTAKRLTRLCTEGKTLTCATCGENQIYVHHDYCFRCKGSGLTPTPPGTAPFSGTAQGQGAPVSPPAANSAAAAPVADAALRSCEVASCKALCSLDAVFCRSCGAAFGGAAATATSASAAPVAVAARASPDRARQGRRSLSQQTRDALRTAGAVSSPSSPEQVLSDGEAYTSALAALEKAQTAAQCIRLIYGQESKEHAASRDRAREAAENVHALRPQARILEDLVRQSSALHAALDAVAQEHQTLQAQAEELLERVARTTSAVEVLAARHSELKSQAATVDASIVTLNEETEATASRAAAALSIDADSAQLASAVTVVKNALAAQPGANKTAVDSFTKDLDMLAAISAASSLPQTPAQAADADADAVPLTTDAVASATAPSQSEAVETAEGAPPCEEAPAADAATALATTAAAAAVKRPLEQDEDLPDFDEDPSASELAKGKMARTE